MLCMHHTSTTGPVALLYNSLFCVGYKRCAWQWFAGATGGPAPPVATSAVPLTPAVMPAPVLAVMMPNPHPSLPLPHPCPPPLQAS